MKRALMVLSALVWVVGFITAQDRVGINYTIVDTLRLPTSSYVGDMVELRYRIQSDVLPDADSGVPEVPWGEITEIATFEIEDGFELRIAAVPYEPGTLFFPVINLGRLQIDGLSLVVDSALTDDDLLVPAYGPQVVPGTRAILFLGAFAIVFPLALIVFLVGPGRAMLERMREWRSGRAPHRQLMRSIDALEQSITNQSPREFYTSLVNALQSLMTDRLGFDCRSATSTELRLYLPALASRSRAPAYLTAPLGEVLSAADQAKFAKERIRLRDRRAHLELVREVAVGLEASRVASKRRAHAPL